MGWRGWRRARFLAVLWALAVYLVVASGRARLEYPGEVQAVTGTDCPPPCVTCHVLPEGGPNWNDFGRRVISKGPGERSWPAILAALKNPDVDTDGDGRLDISEVERGTNPARIDSPNDVVICPLYGCGARIAPGAPSRPLAAIAILAGVALALLARRRRPNR
jgi:MYXO-CTERM domain-containing protein